MTFAWPQLFWLLLAPLALLGWELTHRRHLAATARPKILRAEAGPASLKLSVSAAAAGPDPLARPRVWLFLGLALTIVALARPQWGRLEEPVFDQSREIILAIDLSRSMLTPDVKPSRLERTKLLIQSLLEKLAGERVGLIVFSGTAFLQAPLSADYEILREFLPALSPTFLPEGGTNYNAMLDTALQAFGATNAADRFLVVLSDGEATDSDWRRHFDDLKKKNIRVIALGVGTAGGGMIPDSDGGFVKDERGAVVLSKLESGTLQELAATTGGVYRDASAWIDLSSLVNETVDAGRKGDFVEKNTIRLAERFQWPLAFGVWCLLVSFFYEFPVRPKPRVISLHDPARAKITPLASLLLVAGLPFCLTPSSARAAAKLAPRPAAGAPAAQSAAPGADAATLSKMVGRLANAESPTARDWAELARETATWGSRVKSQSGAAPEGPVRDALNAVSLGEKLDPHATDWSKLRTELETLLEKSEQEKKNDQERKDQKQDKDQQKSKDKNQEAADKNEQEDKASPQDQPQQPQEKSGDTSGNNPSPSNQAERPESQQGGDESKLGEMKKSETPPPPPPPENTQSVGGKPEKKEEEQKEQMNPALALPMQKLEQLRNQDSPALLFQMMDGDKKADFQKTPKNGKNW